MGMGVLSDVSSCVLWWISESVVGGLFVVDLLREVGGCWGARAWKRLWAMRRLKRDGIVLALLLVEGGLCWGLQ